MLQLRPLRGAQRRHARLGRVLRAATRPRGGGRARAARRRRRNLARAPRLPTESRRGAEPRVERPRQGRQAEAAAADARGARRRLLRVAREDARRALHLLRRAQRLARAPAPRGPRDHAALPITGRLRRPAVGRGLERRRAPRALRRQGLGARDAAGRAVDRPRLGAAVAGLDLLVLRDGSDEAVRRGTGHDRRVPRDGRRAPGDEGAHLRPPLRPPRGARRVRGAAAHEPFGGRRGVVARPLPVAHRAGQPPPPGLQPGQAQLAPRRRIGDARSAAASSDGSAFSAILAGRREEIRPCRPW